MFSYTRVLNTQELFVPNNQKNTLFWRIILHSSDLSRLQSTSTGNDIDELVGDRSLTSTVVLELQTVDHVTSVLGRVVHSIATGGS